MSIGTRKSDAKSKRQPTRTRGAVIPVVAVLHVLQPGDGGAADYVVAAAADQRARGWRVAVAGRGGGRFEESLVRQGIPLLTWQASLFDSGAGDEPDIDAGFTGIRRVALDESAWVDHLPGWLRGSDALFQWIVDTAAWRIGHDEGDPLGGILLCNRRGREADRKQGKISGVF